MDHDPGPPGDDAWLVHREVLALVLVGVVAVAGFFVTRAVAGAHAQLRVRDAAAWYRAGRAQLDAGHPAEAADALGRAAAINPDNFDYRLELAAALAEDGRDEASRQVLLALRTRVPENAEVNLRLARLEARRQDLTSAIRYYQSALYGIWPPDHIEQRRRLRVEVIRYLLDHDQRSLALAELLVLDGSLPEDARAYLEAGQLFLAAGDSGRALDSFQRALKLDPRDASALAGAGEAAFGLGDYARAQRYLQSADSDAPTVAALREVTGLVLTRDPLAPRLGFAERRRRLQLNLAELTGRLAACSKAAPQAAAGAPDPAQTLLDEAEAFGTTLRRSRPTIDTIEAGAEIVSRVLSAVTARCGGQEPLDRALVLIGRRHGVERP